MGVGWHFERGRGGLPGIDKAASPDGPRHSRLLLLLLQLGPGGELVFATTGMDAEQRSKGA
jgi:hypothetical protein